MCDSKCQQQLCLFRVLGILLSFWLRRASCTFMRMAQAEVCSTLIESAAVRSACWRKIEICSHVFMLSTGSQQTATHCQFNFTIAALCLATHCVLPNHPSLRGPAHGADTSNKQFVPAILFPPIIMRTASIPRYYPALGCEPTEHAITIDPLRIYVFSVITISVVIKMFRFLTL